MYVYLCMYRLSPRTMYLVRTMRAIARVSLSYVRMSNVKRRANGTLESYLERKARNVHCFVRAATPDVADDISFALYTRVHTHAHTHITRTHTLSPSFSLFVSLKFGISRFSFSFHVYTRIFSTSFPEYRERKMNEDIL